MRVVAFQGINDADNIGYCIPVRVVEHFLQCKRQSKPYRVCALPLRYSAIENVSMKQYLKMIHIPNTNTSESAEKKEENISYSDDEMQGILVDKIWPFTDTADKLRKQDVILEIDGTEIGDDGTIKYDNHSRIDLNYIITNKFEGDSVKIKILREGIIKNVSVVLREHKPLCAVHLFNDNRAEYFIFGGLVFLPLSRPYLQDLFGVNSWTKKAPSTLKYVYFNRLSEFEDQQCIVLSDVLASDITAGYHDYKRLILQTINDDKDNKIRNIAHLAQFVDNLVNNGDKCEFIKFQFESGKTIVLNVNQAMKGGPEILKRHKIEYDRSENLRNLI